jgi:inorganic triphosphatase YgiF
MSQETELKLLLHPRDLPLLQAHPLLTQSVTRHARLLNTYVDTPDLQLQAARMAVRERRVGRTTLLTVKTAGESSGGLSVRGEWEAPTQPGKPDFRALMGEHPLADRLCTLAGRLVPVFRTDFNRQTWILNHEEAVIELALDQGSITSGQGAHAVHEPLLELELELKSGPRAALYSLALDLALPTARSPGIWLMPSDLSKAQRGLAMFEGQRVQALRPAAIALTPAMSLVEAYCSIAWSCMTTLQANLAPLALRREAWSDPELVHQSRVALRRLRTALRLFQSALPRQYVRYWSARWGRLASSLGDAREWDVLTNTWLPRLLPDTARQTQALSWIQPQQEAAWDRARVSLQDPELGATLLAFARGLHGLPSSSSQDPARHAGLDSWARRTLNRTHSRLRRQARDALAAGPQARHELRLALKRERYALECLSSLFAPAQTRPASRALAQAQEVLGWLNDLSTARERLIAAPAALNQLLADRIDQLEARELRRLPATERVLGKLVLFNR